MYGQKEERAGIDMNTLRIALIEDSKEDVDLYKFYLNRAFEDAEIIEFQYGKQALESLKKSPVDCILLDYNLPDMNALELLDKINNNIHDNDMLKEEGTKDVMASVPIIVLTGRGNEDIVVDVFKNGVADYIVKSKITKELLISSVKNALKQFQLQKNLDSKNHEILYQATHDTLTNLYNRKHLEEYFEKMMSKSKRQGYQFAVLYLDLDKFKLVNDNFGHQYGDILLKEFSNRLNAVFRKEDVICRIGGDEFIVVMEYVNKSNEVAEVAKKVVQEVRKPFHIKDKKCEIGVSIGIYFYDGKADIGFDTILQHADKALYAVKQGGKNNFRFFSSELENAYNKKVYIENNLKNIVKNKHLQLVFQPQYDLLTKNPVSFEALLRWQDPFLGQIQPKEFLPIAEETDTIVEIGYWVLAEVASFLKNGVLPKGLTISVNVSAKQLQDIDFINTLKSLFGFDLVALQQIEFEITEPELLSADGQLLQTLEQLQKLGPTIVVDGFGVGSSSLHELSCMDYTKLKVHPSVIKSILESEKNQKVIQFLNSLAETLDIQIIYQGIEDKDTELTLRRLGSHFGQGFYFHKPAHLDKFLH